MSIHQDEQEKYADAWALPAYHTHSPGAVHVGALTDILSRTPGFVGPQGVVVLDAGCGAGAGALALTDAGYLVGGLVDLVDVRSDEVKRLNFPFAQRPLTTPFGSRVCDIAYCCDVLEHVPTQFVGLVIANLLKAARWGVFLSISFEPDQFGVWVGKPLHLTVQPFTWWKDTLGALGRVDEARDLIGQGIFFVREA